MAAVHNFTSGWMPRSRSTPSGDGDQADDADVAGAALLQPVDGGDRGVGGGDHRRHHDDLALGEIGRRLEIILDRDLGLGVAIEADVGDARRRHEIEHAFDQREPARRIGANTSFLPAIFGAFIRVIGVSISAHSSGRSRVTS